MNKHWLGSAPSARWGSLWHFCPGYRRRVLARNLHKGTRNADSSLDCLVLSTGLFCSLLLTVLFSPPLSSDSLWLLWGIPSLLHFRSRGRSGAQALYVGFEPKQTKRTWVAPTQTEMNATHRVTHTHTHTHTYIYIYIYIGIYIYIYNLGDPQKMNP